LARSTVSHAPFCLISGSLAQPLTTFFAFQGSPVYQIHKPMLFVYRELLFSLGSLSRTPPPPMQALLQRSRSLVQPGLGLCRRSEDIFSRISFFDEVFPLPSFFSAIDPSLPPQWLLLCEARFILCSLSAHPGRFPSLLNHFQAYFSSSEDTPSRTPASRTEDDPPPPAAFSETYRPFYAQRNSFRAAGWRGGLVPGSKGSLFAQPTGTVRL